MQDIKPWYRSRTILASLITIAAALAGLGGVPVGPVDGSAIADSLLEGVAAVSGIVAIIGRLSARQRIG